MLTLSHRLGSPGEPLSDLEALAIVLQTAAILDDAHHEGRGHGALTPDDITIDIVGGVARIHVDGLRMGVTARERRSDVCALTGLLFTCLTCELPPYARRDGEADDPPRFDDPRWHWDHVEQRRRELGRPRFAARPCDEGFASIDELRAALRAPLAIELDGARAMDPATERAVRFKEEVDAQRARRERHAEQLRFLDAWFETHAEIVERCDEVYARWASQVEALDALAERVAGPAPPPAPEAPEATIITELPVITAPMAPEPTEAVARPSRTPSTSLAVLVLAVAVLVGWFARPGDAPERSMVRSARAAPRAPAPPPPVPVEARPSEPTEPAVELAASEDASVEPMSEVEEMPPAEEPPAPTQAEVPPEPTADDMVAIPAGAARIGRRTTKVRAFHIDRLEVSQAAYLRCHEAGECALFGRRWDEDEHPATGVTREMATRFCASRGARLPTAEEWLRAAGGARYPWGNRYAKGRMNRRSGDRYRYVAPVDAFEESATPLGVLGMGGNVREWTASDRKGRAVVAGAGYRDSPWTSSARTRRIPADEVRSDLGFRCAK